MIFFLFLSIIINSVVEGKIIDVHKINELNMSLCEEIEIPLHYRRSDLFIKSMSKFEILISDIPLTDCINNNEFRNSSKIAQRISFNENMEFNTTITFCTEKLYLYPLNFSNKSNFKLELNYSKEKGCEEKKSKICERFSEEECLNNLCSEGCKLLTCDSGISNFSLCVSQDLIMKSGFERCQTNNDFFNSNNDVKTSRFKMCENFGISGTNKILVILFVILMFVLTIWITSIIYYRYRINKFKRPPFKKPKCCPHWMYPSLKEEKKELIEDLSDPRSPDKEIELRN